jgi:hypothetical protein
MTRSGLRDLSSNFLSSLAEIPYCTFLIFIKIKWSKIIHDHLDVLFCPDRNYRYRVDQDGKKKQQDDTLSKRKTREQSRHKERIKGMETSDRNKYTSDTSNRNRTTEEIDLASCKLASREHGDVALLIKYLIFILNSIECRRMEIRKWLVGRTRHERDTASSYTAWVYPYVLSVAD